MCICVCVCVCVSVCVKCEVRESAHICVSRPVWTAELAEASRVGDAVSSPLRLVRHVLCGDGPEISCILCYALFWIRIDRTRAISEVYTTVRL
jgi:hypothetical protein